MKKIIIVVIILLLGIGGFYYYNNIYIKNYIPKLDVEENKVLVDEYYIYGNYLSLKGSIKNIDTTYESVDLVLYNGKFKNYELEINITANNIEFSFDDYINKGMYLDNIEVGNYPIFIRFSYLNEDKEKDKYIYKYYVLDNKTEYKETTYYTMSKYNKKILINSNNDYKTMMFNITDNKDKEIYDVVIDPGHGGIDGGATSSDKQYTEASIAMEMALKLKENLENNGLTVKLTREENSLAEGDYFDEYNDGGRAVISHEVSAKYLISLHSNSSTASYVKGFEIYTADNIDYTLAENIRDSIIENTSIDASTNTTNRMETGIYTHNFTESNIASSLEGYDNKGYKRYTVTTNSNYLYMIRETGGIMTGAYVDDSNPDTVGVNPYYNSNIGTESYLIELGYLTNQRDLDILINNQEEYSNAIALGLLNSLNKD